MPGLQVDGLYIALFARDTPDEYHWALYHHWSPKQGTKFHIRNLGEGWIVGHEITSGIQKEFLLDGFIKVAHIPSSRKDTLHSAVTSTPHNIPHITCRTWVLDALLNCINNGLVDCPGLMGLEEEAKSFGFSQFEDTVGNIQPRPVIISTQCHI